MAKQAGIMPIAGAVREENSDMVAPVLIPDAVDGQSAWTPMLAIEEDGVARYLRITDWFGGTGVKPATGYIGTAGTGSKVNASNLNATKRVMLFVASTGAGGIADVPFKPAPGFLIPPAIIAWAVPNILAGPVKAEVVAGTLTKDGVQIKVTQAALLTALVAPLVGATVTVLAIEQ